MPPTQNSQTRFIAFRSARAFRFDIPNASRRAQQSGKAGEIYLTNVNQFARQALAGNRNFEIAQQPVSLPCLPLDAWRTADFRGKRLLVLLPTQALGDCTQALMALHALKESRQPKSITVACAGAAYDIFATNPFLDVRPLWFSRAEAAKFDLTIDLAHMLAGSNIDLWPVDFESTLLQALDIPPSSAYSPAPRALPAGAGLRIGFFPLASSPLRTLPAPVVEQIAGVLAAHGDLTVHLNTWQAQGKILQQALHLPPECTVTESFSSIADLLQAIAQCDYAVFADSGPAHMAKLFSIPGVAVYTSAPAAVLQGRFRNLAPYEVPYQGLYCSAPCGLAKVRQAADGRIGCMGSLGLPLSDLPKTPTASDAAAVQHLMENPVPCVQALGDDADDLANFVEQDIQRRIANAT